MDFIEINPNWIHDVLRELGIPLEGDDSKITIEQFETVVFIKGCNIAVSALLMNPSFDSLSSFQKLKVLRCYLQAFEKYLILGLTVTEDTKCQH
jgi:hypothetical protein